MISAAPPPPPSPSTAPLAVHMTLATQRLRGRPPFLLVGERLVVRGTVSPFVAGQSVTVRFEEDGRRVATSRVSVLPGSNGTGRFRLGFSPRRPGLVQVGAAHAATPELPAFTAQARSVRFVSPDMREGARGPGCGCCSRG